MVSSFRSLRIKRFISLFSAPGYMKWWPFGGKIKEVRTQTPLKSPPKIAEIAARFAGDNRAMLVVLNWRNQELIKIPLNRDTIVIGREPVESQDPSKYVFEVGNKIGIVQNYPQMGFMSGEHCILIWNEGKGKYTINDTSSNGTWISRDGIPAGATKMHGYAVCSHNTVLILGEPCSPHPQIPFYIRIWSK